VKHADTNYSGFMCPRPSSASNTHSIYGSCLSSNHVYPMMGEYIGVQFNQQHCQPILCKLQHLWQGLCKLISKLETTHCFKMYTFQFHNHTNLDSHHY